MNQTRALALVASLLLVALSGCAGLREPASGQPSPSGLIISDGSSEIEIKPDDKAYAPIVEHLGVLIAGLDRPLLAAFSPNRVEDEIVVKPHLEATYSPAVTLKGKECQAEASQLIVAVTEAGPVVLTRVGDANWTACDTSDAKRFTSLFQLVQDQTGIDLKAAAR